MKAAALILATLMLSTASSAGPKLETLTKAHSACMAAGISEATKTGYEGFDTIVYGEGRCYRERDAISSAFGNAALGKVLADWRANNVFD